MKNNTPDNYEEYFANRKVTEDYYTNFKIPSYIQDILPKNKNSKILDIGCGLGQLLSALNKNNYTNTNGIDVSRTAVEFCLREKLNVELIDDIEDYCNNCGVKYNLIFMNHVLEHLNKVKIISTLSAIRENILEEGGAFFVSVPNAQSNTGCYWAFEDFTHNLLFTAGSLDYVLKAAGFKKIKFLDVNGTQESKFYIKIIKYFFLKIYLLKKKFWNKITASSYHEPSLIIFTFELKALAKNE